MYKPQKRNFAGLSSTIDYTHKLHSFTAMFKQYQNMHVKLHTHTKKKGWWKFRAAIKKKIGCDRRKLVSLSPTAAIYNKLPDKTTKSWTARQRRPVSRLRREPFLSWTPTPPPLTTGTLTSPYIYEWNPLSLWSHICICTRKHLFPGTYALSLIVEWTSLKIEDLVYGTSSCLGCIFILFFYFFWWSKKKK